MNLSELKALEMVSIVGGGITSSWINAISKMISTLYDLGERTGSSVRRLVSGNYCKVR